MPEPIKPHPTTPTFFIGMPSPGQSAAGRTGPEIEESIRNERGFVPPEQAAELVAEGFDDHGDALAAADAGSRQAVAQVVAAQLIQEGDDQTRAGRRQRMPSGSMAPPLTLVLSRSSFSALST